MFGKHFLPGMHYPALVNKLFDGDRPLEEFSVADNGSALLELPGEVEVNRRGYRKLDSGVGAEPVDFRQALGEGVNVELDGYRAPAVRHGDGTDREVAGRVHRGFNGNDPSGR
jgi:hypothetical protein